MQELRLIELFAGYGSQAMALKRLEIPYTLDPIEIKRAPT